LGFDFTIQYKPGKDNIPADALSRSFMLALLEPTQLLFKKVVELTQTNGRLKEIYERCLAKPQ